MLHFLTRRRRVGKFLHSLGKVFHTTRQDCRAAALDPPPPPASLSPWVLSVCLSQFTLASHPNQQHPQYLYRLNLQYDTLTWHFGESCKSGGGISALYNLPHRQKFSHLSGRSFTYKTLHLLLLDEVFVWRKKVQSCLILRMHYFSFFAGKGREE